MTMAGRFVSVLAILVVTDGWGRLLARADGLPGGQPSNAQIRTALVSVYYYAYFVRDGRRPELSMKAMSLADAVETLASDHSFGSSARRRVAIGKLGAAYRLLTLGGRRLAHLEPEDVGNALKRLGAPSSVTVAGTPEQGSFQELEAAIYAQLDQEPSDTYAPQCCSCVMSCDTFANGGVGKAHFIVRVARDLDGANGLKEVTDPLEWATCNPLYFSSDTHYAGVDCRSVKGGASSTSTTLPTMGTDWSGVLYEHFSSPAGLDLKNLLNICPDAGMTNPSARRFDYKLCAALGGSAQLNEDCGYATAMPDASTTGPFKSRLDGLKIVDFKPPTQTSIIALEAMVDEIAHRAVCCNLEEPRCPESCGTWTCLLAGGPGSVHNAQCPQCASTVTTTSTTTP